MERPRLHDTVRTLRRRRAGPERPDDRGPESRAQNPDREQSGMESAAKVRREFVKTLLSRKTAPKGWQYFTVHAITHDPETASGYDGAGPRAAATISAILTWLRHMGDTP